LERIILRRSPCARLTIFPTFTARVFASDLEDISEWSAGYTAHRAVNAVPVVCAAAPGIPTTADLPQVIAILGEGASR
jgi:hypothetical protein